jgi:hypothetical protein
MPSGGSGTTPTCSPIRGFIDMGKRALSPRAARSVRPALGEPTIQDPQQTASYQARHEDGGISVPTGGPGSDQQWVPYQAPLPAPTPDGSPEPDDLSTVSASATPLGSEAPEGFQASPDRVRSDTEPPSANQEMQQEEGHEEGPSLADLASQLDAVASSLEAMSDAIPPEAQVDIRDLLPVHASPYGDAPAIEAVLEPTLQMPPRKDPEFLPSAPTQCMLHQALQQQGFEHVQEEEPSHQDLVPGQSGSSTDQRQERAHETHRAHLEPGAIPMMEMDVRWEKVRQQPRLPKPTADGAEVKQSLRVERLGKHHTQEMRNTTEEGTVIVTCQDNRVGISKTIQGCREGAWLEDTADHVEILAARVDQASQEMLANMYTNYDNAQDDVKTGRRAGPMLATLGMGHFGFWREIEGGSPETMAVTKHFGLVGPEVSSQIPMADVDPNQSPLHQIRKTMVIATKFKEETTKLWEAMTNVANAAETLSNNCHALQLQTVVRAEGATHPTSEDAQPSPELGGKSMADS